MRPALPVPRLDAHSRAFPESVTPLNVSANRWISSTVHRTGIDSAEIVIRKVRALLNKLTNQKFDSISDQIIAWANTSQNEEDGRTLVHVISLVFEQMTDEATWSETFARLCRKITEKISLQVQANGMTKLNPEGKPIAGGQLFRKCLLIRCQEDLERGWVARQPTTLDECYAASKEKRQGLGLIKFAGELFKLQMLTEYIMHERIKKFLDSAKCLKEEDMESLCQLMMTVGQLLDVPKARAHMDVYFTRMGELCNNPSVSRRIRFKLQDVIELRQQRWMARDTVIPPTTVSVVYEAAAKEKTVAGVPSYQRQLDTKRSALGGDQNVESGPDHRNTPRSSAAQPQPARDSSQFGKISTTFTGSSSGVPMEQENTFDSLLPRSSNLNIGRSQSPEIVAGVLGDAPAALRVEPIVPLDMPTNRWISASTIREPGTGDTNFPKLVDQRVRALLDNLTTEKFDFISDQIVAWANKSQNEKDGRTLIQVVRLVFGKATEDAACSEMYARLCRKMMERISPEVQDDGIRNADGKPFAGGQLFRKYLLNRCQEDFERGWVAKETTAAAAAAKASDDQAVKAADEKKGDESELYSDEYYAAQKAKRHGLGVIKFIGELFKLQMLAERIMHECVKKLLGNVENPEEEEIESLCQLLKTAGQLLDVPKARAYMDAYFTRMKELCKSLNVSPRMQFMLQDVIELRDRKWVARGAVIAPTTISAIHEAAAKEKAAAEAQSYQRQISMSRGGSRRGGERNVESGPDRWTTTGSPIITRPQPKAGDLFQFGKISKAAPMVMDPSSVFTKKDAKRDALSQTSNIFSMPRRDPELAVDAIAKSSQPPSWKPSVDLGQGRAPEPALRKKLQLLPRTKPTQEEEIPPPASEEESEVLVRMSQFGKINKAAPMVMGPGSVFTKKDAKRDTLSQTTSNIFSRPRWDLEPTVDAVTESSRSLNWRSPLQREKLQLLPRTKPILTEENPPVPEAQNKALVQMSKADVLKSIEEYVREFFAIRSLEKANVYFTNLPEGYRYRLVDKLVASALESKEADAVLVSELFYQAASKGLCSSKIFEAGFMPLAELLDDITVYFPKALKFMAIMLRGAGFDENGKGLARIAGKSVDGDKLIQLVSW